MQRLHDLEAGLAAFEQKTMRAVTAAERQNSSVGRGLPRLSAASTTKPRVASAFCVSSCATSPSRREQSQKRQLQVRWQGGETGTLRIQMPQDRADVHPLYRSIRRSPSRVGVDLMTKKSSACWRKKAKRARRPAAGHARHSQMVALTEHRIPAPSLRQGPWMFVKFVEKYRDEPLGRPLLGRTQHRIHSTPNSGCPIRDYPSTKKPIDASDDGSSIRPIFIHRPQRNCFSALCPPRRNPQRPRFAIALRYVDPPDRRRKLAKNNRQFQSL